VSRCDFDAWIYITREKEIEREGRVGGRVEEEEEEAGWQGYLGRSLLRRVYNVLVDALRTRETCFHLGAKPRCELHNPGHACCITSKQCASRLLDTH